MKFNFKFSDNRALYNDCYLHTYSGGVYLMKYVSEGIYTLTDMRQNRIIMRDLTLKLIEDNIRSKVSNCWKISKTIAKYEEIS